MSVVDKMKDSFEEMTKSERKVASYFLGHHDDFVFFTLEKAAEEIGISTTSVIRFCRRMGFGGFKEFQEALREDVRFRPDLPLKYEYTKEHGDALWSRVLTEDIGCLRETYRANSPSVIKEAVRLLAASPRVYTFGMKESFALSHYAYTRLITVRDNVSILSAGLNGAVEPILSIGKEDVCLVFLFPRYTKQALDLLPLLKRQTENIILVTSDPAEAVEKQAKILLKCFVNINGIKNSSVAPIFLCDYLCNAAAIYNGEKSLSYMKETEKLFRESSMVSL